MFLFFEIFDILIIWRHYSEKLAKHIIWFKMIWSSVYGYMVDALALTGDEGRGKLR